MLQQTTLFVVNTDKNYRHDHQGAPWLFSNKLLLEFKVKGLSMVIVQWSIQKKVPNGFQTQKIIFSDYGPIIISKFLPDSLTPVLKCDFSKNSVLIPIQKFI